MELPVVNFSKYHHNLSAVSTYNIKGKVTELTGLVVRAVVPGVRIGELCFIEPYHSKNAIKAEVVGFRDQEVLLMPLGDLEGIGLGNSVIPTGQSLTVRVGEGLLGRILDGLGDPLDEATQGPLDCVEEYPVHANPPEALSRRRVTEPISLGIKAIDATLTCGEGQRVGIFSAAGVGKSTLIGMIARNTEAEINVICLVGERGREVRDFLEKARGKVPDEAWSRANLTLGNIARAIKSWDNRKIYSKSRDIRYIEKDGAWKGRRNTAY